MWLLDQDRQVDVTDIFMDMKEQDRIENWKEIKKNT